MKISRYVSVFIGIATIALVTICYIRKAFYPDPDLTKISLGDYDTIQIENRGLDLQFKRLVLFKQGDIISFCNLLKKSRLVSFDTINIKANQGLCEICMIGRKKPLTYTYSQTSFSGGIILTNNACYRNDSLLNFLEQSASYTSSARRE